MCAVWWGWHPLRYCVNNDFDSATSEICLGWESWEITLERMLNYSLSAISVGSNTLPIERPDLAFGSHVLVGCKTTAEANDRVYDDMV